MNDSGAATTVSDRKVVAAFVLVLLGASPACVAIAPSLMPASYSWIEHSISESAAHEWWLS